jgi:hypothetical protein
MPALRERHHQRSACYTCLELVGYPIHAFESRCRLDERHPDGSLSSPAMNDEAESSGAAQRHPDSSPELADAEDAITQIDDEEVQRLKEQLIKERRLDAKRKRIRMLNELLRELDLAVYMQLIAVYHLEYDSFPCTPHGHALNSLLQLLVLLARNQSLHPRQLAHPRVRPDW